MKKTIFFSLMLVLALGLFSCTGKQGSLEYDESYAYYDVKFEYNELHYRIINHNSVLLVQHDSHKSLSGELVIPSTVRYNDATYYVVGIGYEAFYKCTGLTSVTIPNSVKVIKDEAFRSCYSLSSITLPDGITNLSSNAFDNTHYYNNEANWENGVLYIGKYLVATIEMPHYSIKKGTKYIASYAFRGNNMLRSITIPNSVTSIGEGTFAYCKSLTTVTIPNSVTSIGERAFYGCSGLTSPVYNAHCFAYMPTSYKGAYIIPEGIKQIAGGAFDGCSGLRSVIIPNSVTSIGDGAFWACDGLTSITIPNSVTSIGFQAFYYCTGLTSITIPNSVTSIGRFTFEGCTGLTSVTIPNSVTSIGDGAFWTCSGLTSVSVPAHTEIGEYAFSYRTKIIRK